MRSDALVGVYSPHEIMCSQVGCKAFGNRGYAAANIVLWARS